MQHVPPISTYTRYARSLAFYTHNLSMRTHNRTSPLRCLCKSTHELWSSNLCLSGCINGCTYLGRELRFKLPCLFTAQPVHLQSQRLPRLPALLEPRHPFRVLAHDSQRTRPPIIKLEPCLCFQTLH